MSLPQGTNPSKQNGANLSPFNLIISQDQKEELKARSMKYQRRRFQSVFFDTKSS
jgi:hypothetical protein